MKLPDDFFGDRLSILMDQRNHSRRGEHHHNALEGFDHRDAFETGSCGLHRY